MGSGGLARIPRKYMVPWLQASFVVDALARVLQRAAYQFWPFFGALGALGAFDSLGAFGSETKDGFSGPRSQ